jgi:hypothetical protein
MVDGKGNEYKEVTVGGTKIRTTLVKDGWNGEPGVRVQVAKANGGLNQGPEIPLSGMGQVFGAAVELLAKR